MREDRQEAILVEIERDIPKYLDSKGRLSAVKIAGFHYLTNSEGYQLKVVEEYSLDQMARDPDYGGSPEHPLTYAEVGENRKRRFAELQANGVGVAVSQTS